MDLCICVSEYPEDGEGVVLEEISRLSLDTHRREVSGTTLSALLWKTDQNLLYNQIPGNIPITDPHDRVHLKQ